MLDPRTPALALAPMDGITDAAMRAFQGATGAFTFAVTEFLRVSQEPIPKKVFRRDVPELSNGGRTLTGLPVQIQLLGGDPGRMAQSAVIACEAGAPGIDINFGCPAPTVNRHDGEQLCSCILAASGRSLPQFGRRFRATFLYRRSYGLDGIRWTQSTKTPRWLRRAGHLG